MDSDRPAPAPIVGPSAGRCRRRSAVAAAACLALWSTGCWSSQDKWEKARPETAEVAGVVLHDGAPVSDAIVTFRPDGGTHSAYDRTDENGRFQLTTFEDGDGAVPGQYRVTVSKVVVDYEPNPKNPEVLPPLYHAEQSVLPSEYAEADTSGLTATVPEDGTDEIEFSLSGSPGPKTVFVPRKG